MSSPPALSLEDYDEIASAVMETERGRWFLAEFARRNRAADTAAVLEALAAVEARLSGRTASAPEAEEAARRVASALETATQVRASLKNTDADAVEGLRAVEDDLTKALRALGAPQAAALVALAAPGVAEPAKTVEPPAEPRIDRPAERPAPAAPPRAASAWREPPPPVRPRPLLDRLSAAEKAILFA
ncbi:hypothetical protein [Chenggangzhangella methanolivorans]|uniref:Uncharacterized protein n=1 Tax=Chenggangzhangella methanolivorans TaxID=1437009 RepID=A0A9E6R8X1_9HYPH|nr:hypothetical protein [Chenggangzhangella methanolivorans]QZN99474.1 hypothetical protein K6K41_22605 [Chenggangzhangella methanolivorans]